MSPPSFEIRPTTQTRPYLLQPTCCSSSTKPTPIRNTSSPACHAACCPAHTHGRPSPHSPLLHCHHALCLLLLAAAEEVGRLEWVGAQAPTQARRCHCAAALPLWHAGRVGVGVGALQRGQWRCVCVVGRVRLRACRGCCCCCCAWKGGGAAGLWRPACGRGRRLRRACVGGEERRIWVGVVGCGLGAA